MAMSLGKVFEPFVEQRPICVMARGVLENLFNADKIDALFARTAEVQYTRELLMVAARRGPTARCNTASARRAPAAARAPFPP